MTNPIKEVAHPPGQVVNMAEAHQQLSDYIRSIKQRICLTKDDEILLETQNIAY